MESIVVIVNPAARNGRLGRRLDAVRRAVRSTWPHAEVLVTEGPGHATDLAFSRADRDAVIAAGGDGTVHEVADGLARAIGIPRDAPDRADGILGVSPDVRRRVAALGTLPLGTGNDLAWAVGVLPGLGSALQSLSDSTRRPMDYGLAVLNDDASTRLTFFNAIGIGFDALASERSVRFKGLPGSLGYTAGVFSALRRWTGPTASVESGEQRVEWPLMFATIGNAARSGGGYLLTPDASPFDGNLDVCMARYMKLLPALRVMPETRLGTHVNREQVRIMRGTTVNFASERAVPVHVDGEVLPYHCVRVDARMVRHGLDVLVPNNAGHQAGLPSYLGKASFQSDG